MGHAGAIISGGKGDANSKIEAMKSAGIRVAAEPGGAGDDAGVKLLGVEVTLAPSKITMRPGLTRPPSALRAQRKICAEAQKNPAFFSLRVKYPNARLAG